MSMLIPIKLATLMGLTALLQGITPAAGYQHDLSDYVDTNGDTRPRVFRGRNVFGMDDPLPMLSILEEPRPEWGFAPEFSGLGAGPWPLFVQGFVQDDPTNPTDPAHYLMADVKKCLALHLKAALGSGNIFGVGRAVRSYKIATGVVRPPDDVSAMANFFLPLTLEFFEDMTSPFAYP